MLGYTPNLKKRIMLSLPGSETQIPLTVLHGSKPGKTITVAAGIHSREYIGVEATVRMAAELEPEDICGSVIFIHCCNYNGFIRRTPDTLPEDGKNLNREFPGKADGTLTQRLALFLEKEIIENTDYLIDLHSGGYCEELTPHVYYQGAAVPEVCAVSERLAELTSTKYLVRSTVKNGFFSYAGLCGVPAIILERGGCGLVKENEIQEDIDDVKNILAGMGFLRDASVKAHNHIRISDGFYEDAPCSGCWYPYKMPGDTVRKGETLGQIRTVFGELLEDIKAQCDAVILYQTASLGIEANSPMIAYGKI